MSTRHLQTAVLTIGILATTVLGAKLGPGLIALAEEGQPEKGTFEIEVSGFTVIGKIPFQLSGSGSAFGKSEIGFKLTFENAVLLANQQEFSGLRGMAMVEGGRLHMTVSSEGTSEPQPGKLMVHVFAEGTYDVGKVAVSGFFNIFRHEQSGHQSANTPPNVEALSAGFKAEGLLSIDAVHKGGSAHVSFQGEGVSFTGAGRFEYVDEDKIMGLVNGTLVVNGEESKVVGRFYAELKAHGMFGLMLMTGDSSTTPIGSQPFHLLEGKVMASGSNKLTFEGKLVLIGAKDSVVVSGQVVFIEDSSSRNSTVRSGRTLI